MIPLNRICDYPAKWSLGKPAIVRLAALLLSLLYFAASDLHADEYKKLKREVLSDCAAAQISFELIPATSRKDIVPYLGRVLGLHLNIVQALPVTMSDPNHPPSLPLTDSRLGENVLLGNPNEELSAKQCALQLLEKLKPDSFSVLPEIFELLSKATNPLSLRSAAGITARSLAQAFAQQKESISPESTETITSVFKYLTGDTLYAARSVLIELGNVSLPLLIDKFGKANESESVEIGSVLEAINSLDTPVSPLLYPLLTNSDEQTRIRVMNLLARLKPPLSEVLPTLVKLLDDISPQVRHDCRLTIQQIVSKGSATLFSLESTIQDALVTNYRIAAISERNEMLPWIPHLLKHVDGLLPRFLALAQGAQRELKRDLLESLSMSAPLSPDAFKIVSQSLNDPDIGVRVMAIRALGAFPNLSNSASKALNQIFKTLPPSKDLTERIPLLDAAIAASSTMSTSGDITLVPHLIKSLEAPIPPEQESDYRDFPRNQETSMIRSRYRDHPGVRALSTWGEHARAPLENIAKNGNSDQARRAIAALSELPLKESSVKLLAQLLGSNHEATVNESARAILRLGAPVIPQLRKTSTILPLKAKLHVSELMIILGEKTLSDTKDLFKSLERADCETRVHRILLIGDFTPSERAKLIPFTLTCLGQNHEQDHGTISALAHLAPLDPQAQDSLIEIVRSQQSSSQLKLAILDSARTLSLASEKLQPEYRGLIQHSQGPLQIRAIRSLGKFGSASQELVEILKEMISSSDAEKPRSFAIVATLAKLDGVEFNFHDWIEDALEAESYEQVRKLLRSFSPDQIQAILLAIISGNSDRKRLLALRLASELVTAQSTLPTVYEELLSSSDIQLKFTALKVALACCPLNSKVTTALRELLYSPANYELVKLRIPETLRNFLNDLIDHSPFLSERSLAKQLKEGISSHKAL